MKELSTKIQLARDTLQDLQTIFERNAIQLDENERITQDILHQIELGSYNEGRKWYGTLRKTRKDRRTNKDTLEILTKFKMLMETDYAIKFMRQLDEVLGDARNQEKKLANRHYNAKYIQNLPISKDVVD